MHLSDTLLERIRRTNAPEAADHRGLLGRIPNPIVGTHAVDYLFSREREEDWRAEDHLRGLPAGDEGAVTWVELERPATVRGEHYGVRKPADLPEQWGWVLQAIPIQMALDEIGHGEHDEPATEGAVTAMRGLLYTGIARTAKGEGVPELGCTVWLFLDDRGRLSAEPAWGGLVPEGAERPTAEQLRRERRRWYRLLMPALLTLDVLANADPGDQRVFVVPAVPPTWRALAAARR